MYMQYKNSGAWNKPSLSQKLAETVVLPTEDQDNDSDDDFINLDYNSSGILIPLMISLGKSKMQLRLCAMKWTVASS